MIPRSWLFVPADSPSKISKAQSSGADALILDLEDSVAPPRKCEARREVQRALGRGGASQMWVRINPIGVEGWKDDLAVAMEGAAGVVFPKCRSASDLMQLDIELDRLGAPSAFGILPIATETPGALFGLGSYGGVTSRLKGLAWGAEDLSAAVGASTAREADGSYTPLYELARSLCLAGAAAADTAPIETVFPDFQDSARLAAYAVRGRRDGFVGMLAIHPRQVEVINDAFSPSPAELKAAREIVELFSSHPGAGTLSLRGRMLDAPHLARAMKVLTRVSDRRFENAADADDFDPPHDYRRS